MASADRIEAYERPDRDESPDLTAGAAAGGGTGNPFRNRSFLDLFHGSASRIASHRDTLAVIHLPGELVVNDGDAVCFRNLLNDIALAWLLGMKLVVVAGCRHRASGGVGRRERHGGTTVTDPGSLRAAKEEAGFVRFEVERQLAVALKSGGCCVSSPVSSSSAAAGHHPIEGNFGGGNVVSGNFYSAQPFNVPDGTDHRHNNNNINSGGSVRTVEVSKIREVHRNRDVVLLTPLGPSPTGEVFRVDSEYLAARAAAELGATTIVYVLERNAGLRRRSDGREVSRLGLKDGRELLDRNGVRIRRNGRAGRENDEHDDDGPRRRFLVKMGWGLTALEEGNVERVHLISPFDDGALLRELYTREGSGTTIVSCESNDDDGDVDDDDSRDDEILGANSVEDAAAI